MRLLLTKALRDIQRRPLRTLLTTLGVLLGVAGVVAISYTGRSLADAQRETYASTRQPDITAFAAQLSPTLVDLIGRRDNVVAVDTQAVQITRASTGDRWVNTRLVGVADFTNMRLDAVQLVSGRFPGPGEVAFDASATKLIDVEIGDLVALQPTPASPINYARVSGFVRAPATIDASILNQATAYMPARDVRQILGATTTITFWFAWPSPSAPQRPPTRSAPSSTSEAWRRAISPFATRTSSPGAAS